MEVRTMAMLKVDGYATRVVYDSKDQIMPFRVEERLAGKRFKQYNAFDRLSFAVDCAGRLLVDFVAKGK